uniref:LYR motif-containing protein 1 n=1 Tax=Caligus rogercresseyi TaxID=217165 RepID=C1BRR2_CALRO|nr:LYR motif-containing protein 1 [Caligus rogercresseyi]
MSAPKTLYKRLLRLGASWIAQNHPSQTSIERKYIIEETRNLFRANKNLTDEEEIRKCVLEAEARLTMAEHYKNPYPRPVNLPKGIYSKKQGKAQGKAMQRKSQASRPVYVKSLE